MQNDNKFIVPADKLEAANRLKENYLIRSGCDSILRDVMDKAKNQGVLAVRGNTGKIAYQSVGLSNLDAYCLSDDCEILVEENTTRTIPNWVIEKYAGFPIEQRKNGMAFRVHLPDGEQLELNFLPTALLATNKEWVHTGWLVDGCNKIVSVPSGFVDASGNFWVSFGERASDTKVVAHTSVWQKVED